MPDRVRDLIAVAVIGISAIVTVVSLTADDAPAADRVEHLASRLKCPVCQSESINDSPSDLARDLKDLIAEQVASGMSDEEIIDFFVASYGEEVLLDPPATGRAALLWIIPVAVLLLGVVAVLGRRAAVPRALSPEEERRVDEALEGSGDD